MNDREVFDLLWAVSRWSQLFGYESAQPGADRSRVDEAFRLRQEALAEATAKLVMRDD
jgi:hypothetical protein